MNADRIRVQGFCGPEGPSAARWRHFQVQTVECSNGAPMDDSSLREHSTVCT